jgi:hypothetical protein
MLYLSKKSTAVNLINISFFSAVFYFLRCYRCISLCNCSSKMRKCRLYIRLITLVCLACKMETKVHYLASSFVKYVLFCCKISLVIPADIIIRKLVNFTQVLIDLPW